MLDQPQIARSRSPYLLACVVLLGIFAATSWTAWMGRYATTDEPQHLVAGFVQTHYGDFRCDPENPPLWKYYFSVGTSIDDLKIDTDSPQWRQMLASANAQGDFYEKTLFQTPGNDPDHLLRMARARMLALGVLLGALIAWWAWRLGGPLAGVVAAAAFCLDPNFLAHSALVKNDVPMALVVFGLMIAVWKLGIRITIWRWLAISLLLAAAVTTKYSGVFAIPTMVIALGIRAVAAEPWPFGRRVLRTRFARLGAAVAMCISALLIAWIGIWACYGFRFEMSADPSAHFNEADAVQICISQESILAHGAPAHYSDAEYRQWLQQWRPSLVVRGGEWMLSHHVLPEGWLVGSLLVYGTSLVRSSFLCGQISQTGWWYYFPLAMLFKTPLATLTGLALAAGVGLGWIWRRNFRWWTLVAMTISPVIFLGDAMHSNYNVGLRHVLVVYPFLFVLLGVATADAFRRWPRIAGPIIALLSIGLAIETFAAYPNFIPFFNAAAGRSRGGIRLLGDSNLDWDQDLSLLKEWEMQNPSRPVCLMLPRYVDPDYYGIRDTGVAPPLPGQVYAVSATVLQGLFLTDQMRRETEPFRHRPPLAVLGGSIYLFDLPGDHGGGS